MTTVVRPVGDSDGKRRPERLEEAVADADIRESDVEWVVDLRSKRIVRRNIGISRTNR